MLHHSGSRHQRNRGSRIKTLLQVTLLVGVVVWLVYQVKHSYDKKNEYLDDTADQLAQNDRSMFQGRKERVGSFGNGNVEKAGENSDVLSKPEEEKSGETVFEKESNDSHEDAARNTERSEAEEVQANGADGNVEDHPNDNDETSGHSGYKHDAESNSSGAESKSEIHSNGGDETENNHSQEENTGETNGTSHEEVVQGDESNSDQTNAISNGSDGEEEKKEDVDSQTASGSLSDDNKTTGGGRGTETLPDETDNLPLFHNENPQNDASENQEDAGSTISNASEHNASGTSHIKVGYEHEGTTSSGVASDDDEKHAETVMANEVSNSKGENSEEGNTAREIFSEKAANTEMENSQGGSTAEVANGSSEETKRENWSEGATETSNNGEQKIEMGTFTNEEHNGSQGGGDNSGSNGSNVSGPEQTGKTEAQR